MPGAKADLTLSIEVTPAVLSRFSYAGPCRIGLTRSIFQILSSPKNGPHGFRNIATTPASVMVVFVLLDKPATGKQASSAEENGEEAAILAEALGALLAYPAAFAPSKH